MSDVFSDYHRRIVMGIEIEAYSVDRSDYAIGRRLSRPRPGLSEAGERFARDSSIGSEYNSRPLESVREALFLIKTGLRKYIRGLYRGGANGHVHDYCVPLLVGGWTNRFAGTHVHLSLADKVLTPELARSLASHLHDHLPFFIAVGANSPIWDKKLTGRASNRFLRGNATYFKPTPRGRLCCDDDMMEIVYNPGRKRKPPTLEIRALDSNLPEFVVAEMCLIKAAALRWLRRKPALHRLEHDDYLRAREAAGAAGMKARLHWNGDTLPARKYLDRFIWEHRDELREMDIPAEIWDVFKLLKKGYNGARIFHDAARVAQKEHPQTWQRRFAKRYSAGLEKLLSGNTLQEFASELEVELPGIENVWLGRRGASVDG